MTEEFKELERVQELWSELLLRNLQLLLQRILEFLSMFKFW